MSGGSWPRALARPVRSVSIGAMPQAAQHAQYTFADYVALEAESNVRHEFLGGQMYAMAGGTPEHAALAAAVSGFLFGQL